MHKPVFHRHYVLTSNPCKACRTNLEFKGFKEFNKGLKNLFGKTRIFSTHQISLKISKFNQELIIIKFNTAY